MIYRSKYRYTDIIAAYTEAKPAIENCIVIALEILGPVVRMPVSTNPGLNFNPAFFFLLSKALSDNFLHSF